MSKERYQRIRQYGGELDLTPGSESDVILVLERTEDYKKDPNNKVLAQFELLPNYRFHRYVTGPSAIEAAQPYGNGRVAAFVSAPGSAGTLAAGDEIKARFPDSVVCALEPEGVLHPVQQWPGHAPHRRHRRQDGHPDPQRTDHRLCDADPRRRLCAGPGDFWSAACRWWNSGLPQGKLASWQACSAYRDLQRAGRDPPCPTFESGTAG